MMLLRSPARLFAGVGLFFIAACKATPEAGPVEAGLVERTAAAMGTELRLTAWTADEPGALKAFAAVFQEMDRLEGLMSTWIEDSEIVRLNAAAGVHPVSVSRDIVELLKTANQVSEWTAGKFDVTFSALSGLWKFDYQNKDDTIPERQETTCMLAGFGVNGHGISAFGIPAARQIPRLRRWSFPTRRSAHRATMNVFLLRMDAAIITLLIPTRASPLVCAGR
jgi:thiamine biosynthesis lipoprotein ApbE